MTLLDSGILIKYVKDQKMFLLDATEAEFGIPWKGKFHATVLYLLDINFLKYAIIVG